MGGNFKGTPGPWRVKFSRFSEVIAENGAVVAKVQKLTSLAQVQADASLIATAHDLLSIAQRLVNLAEGLDNSNSSAEEAAARLATEARAVVAKVMGDA